MKILVTEQQFQSIIENNMEGLYEQTTGTTRPIDLNYILVQSESDKTTNEFCKSKTGYDVCLSVKHSDRTTRDNIDNDRSRILQSGGYTMIEKSPLTQDTDGKYNKSSIWKKS